MSAPITPIKPPRSVEHFRQRAKLCRELVKTERSAEVYRCLLDLAENYENAAKMLETTEAPQRVP